MTKAELIKMIEEVPDCYALDFGPDFTIHIDSKECKAMAGTKSATNAKFIPWSGRAGVCRYADDCCHFVQE